MKTLYLDCFAGISGDMFVGALIDLGLQTADLERELKKLNVGGYQLQVSVEKKNEIQATAFRVYLEDGKHKRLADSEFLEVPTLELEPKAPRFPEHASESRSLADILSLIESSGLSERVKTISSEAFNRLANAEAKVHGTSPQEVHFHEVGGADAIVDIVSAAVGLEALGIEQVFASSLHLGSGFVRSSHGLLPVPAPATAELLRGVPVYTTQATGELVTPTGAAILITVAAGFRPMPELRIQAVGYGAGSRMREFPNILRAYLGDSIEEKSAPGRSPRDPFPQQHLAGASEDGYHAAEAMMLEANIDDSNPQWYELLMDRLLAEGALDIVLVPIQMKKNRPGVMLQVLSPPEKLDSLMRIIFRDSTTIGIRTYPVLKHMLQREILQVTTDYGELRVKISKMGTEVMNVTPEYEDCRDLAIKNGVSIKEIYRSALIAYQGTLKGNDQ